MLVRMVLIVTIVILEAVLSSDGATDNDSILKLLAENNPATLDSAPDSFSKSTEIICLILCSKYILYSLSF